MILIHINSCFYPTNWYVLIHIICVTRKKLNHGGTSCPAGCHISSLRPLVVPPSCPALPIATALTVALSIACRPCALRCRCGAAAAAASALPPLHYAPVCWLVVALMSAVRFRHHMPSCDRWRSHCQPAHFCTNWYVLIWTTSIIVINIDSTRKLYKFV